MKTSKISSFMETAGTVRSAFPDSLAVVLVGLIALNLAMVGGHAQPGNDTSGAEVLTRGPVHEAFAGVVAFNPEPGIVISKAPPDVIEEMPPEERPEGDNVSWIPGYWGWDDERSDFLWVSGTWRALPPGRAWMAGYWGQTPQGHQWISGYWADASVRETTYLPPPPLTVEVGPNIAAPSIDYGWSPGCWIWYQGRYAWQPGYWAQGRADWDWMPAHYVWTPRGHIFVGGYWDYPVQRRGIVFAPIYFEPRVYARRGYVYSPSIVISLNVFSDHLFLRPRYSHYYFGDYYAPSYYQGGFYASFSFHSGRRGYDPFYSRQRWTHRQDRDWERRVETSYHYRRDHEAARPPRTWTAQRNISPRTAESGENRMLVAAPIEQVAKRREGGMRFQSVAATERQEFTVRSREVQKIREERRTLEAKATAPTDRRPGETIQAATVQLPKSPIVAKAANRMDRNQAPPEIPQAPKPDLKRQPKSEPAARPQNVERNQPQPEVRQPEPGKPLPPGRSQTTPRERPVEPEAQPRPSRERGAQPAKETERTPQGLEKKAPRESQSSPDDSAVRVREESQRNVRAQEQQAQQESERRAKDAASKATEESQRNARGLEKKAQQESEQRANDAAAKARDESQRNVRAQEQRTQQQESERRAKDAASKAEESQRNARGLEKKAQQDSEQRANNAAAKARDESQRNVRAQEQRTQQQESERRAKDTAARAAEESQRNARAQQAQQQESERRARDATVKAREDSQRNARNVERQTPPSAQPRANPPEKSQGADKQQQEQPPPRVSEPPSRNRPAPSEKGATKLRERDRQKEGKGKP